MAAAPGPGTAPGAGPGTGLDARKLTSFPRLPFLVECHHVRADLGLIPAGPGRGRHGAVPCQRALLAAACPGLRPALQAAQEQSQDDGSSRIIMPDFTYAQLRAVTRALRGRITVQDLDQEVREFLLLWGFRPELLVKSEMTCTPAGRTTDDDVDSELDDEEGEEDAHLAEEDDDMAYMAVAADYNIDDDDQADHSLDLDHSGLPGEPSRQDRARKPPKKQPRKRIRFCTICQKEYANLGQHYSNVHPDIRKEPCPKCGAELFPQTLPEHLEKHERLEADRAAKGLDCYVACNVCGKDVMPVRISCHYVKSHPDVPSPKTPCTQCNRVLYPEIMTNHLRKHELERMIEDGVPIPDDSPEVICKSCGALIKREVIQQHQKWHEQRKLAHREINNRRKKTCPICLQQVRPDNLERHLNTHRMPDLALAKVEAVLGYQDDDDEELDGLDPALVKTNLRKGQAAAGQAELQDDDDDDLYDPDYIAASPNFDVFEDTYDDEDDFSMAPGSSSSRVKKEPKLSSDSGNDGDLSPYEDEDYSESSEDSDAAWEPASRRNKHKHKGKGKANKRHLQDDLGEQPSGYFEDDYFVAPPKMPRMSNEAAKEFQDKAYIDEKVRCFQCKRNVPRISLAKHYRNHHQDIKESAKKKCTKCSQRLFEENVELHMQKHEFNENKIEEKPVERDGQMVVPCGKCGRYVPESKWEHHKEFHETKAAREAELKLARRVTCQICQKKVDPYSLKSHMSWHASKSQREQRKAGKIDEDEVKPQTDSNKEKPDKVPCDECGKMMLPTSLKLHKRKHQPEADSSKPKEVSMVICERCGESLNKDKYRNHIKRCTGKGKSYDTKMWHLNMRKDDPTRCPVDDCQHVYPTINGCRSHYTSVHLKKTCQDCGKQMSKSELKNHALKMHGRVLEKMKFHKCDQCGKMFSYKYHLKEHIEADHVREMKYFCEICGKGFYTQRTCSMHVYESHKRGKRNFYCEVCGKTSRSWKPLVVHMRDDHGRLMPKEYRPPCKE